MKTRNRSLLALGARRNFERPFRIAASHPRASDNPDWTKPLARQLFLQRSWYGARAAATRAATFI